MMELFHDNFDRLFMVAWVVAMIVLLRRVIAANARYGSGESQ